MKQTNLTCSILSLVSMGLAVCAALVIPTGKVCVDFAIVFAPMGLAIIFLVPVLCSACGKNGLFEKKAALEEKLDSAGTTLEKMQRKIECLEKNAAQNAPDLKSVLGQVAEMQRQQVQRDQNFLYALGKIVAKLNPEADQTEKDEQ